MSDETGVATETVPGPAPKAETETEETQETQQGETLYTQADFDRGISKALDTREKKLRDEAETEKLREKEDYAALTQRQDAKIKELEEGRTRSDFIQQHNLNEFSSVLSNVPVDQLDTAKEAINNAVNAAVQRQVSARLETPAPIPGTETTPSAVKDMSPEEYKSYKKSQGIT